jgi:catechol 2,3-dioxygenase-like lactoylglutathione lyase family enzyme
MNTLRSNRERARLALANGAHDMILPVLWATTTDAGGRFGGTASGFVNFHHHRYRRHTRRCGLQRSERGKKADPIIVFDASGKFLRSWGKGMFEAAHGLRVDRNDNVFVIDITTQQVIKFAKEGKVLLTGPEAPAEATRKRSTGRPTSPSLLTALFMSQQVDMIRHISAVTFAIRDIARSIEFYRKLGFELVYGGDHAAFSSMKAGEAFVNLVVSPAYERRWWGRAIFRVDDVDEHRLALQAKGVEPESPRDAPWGERFFQVTDPDGHELSFAELLQARS